LTTFAFVGFQKVIQWFIPQLKNQFEGRRFGYSFSNYS
jgi:hypothetical protein